MIKVAIIGCGRIALRHAGLLKSEIKGVELVSVCDIDELKARDFARDYGVSYYTEIETMMTNEDIDFCLLYTSPSPRD